MKNLPQEEILKSLGDRIRAIRVEKKMKQNEVAILCGFYKSGYNAIETGIRNVSVLTLCKIASVLNEPMSSFFPDNTFNALLKKDKAKAKAVK